MSGLKKITMQSKLKEVYASPVGKDILGKVLMQLGLGDWVVTNPVVGNITLGGLKKLAGKKLDDTFFNAIIGIFNRRFAFSSIHQNYKFY